MNQINSHPLYKIHNIDTAISSLWEFYKKKFFGLFAVSIVLAFTSQYLSTMIDISELQAITDPQELLLKMRDFLWPVILISVVSLFFSTIMHYYVLYNPLDAENNLLSCAIKSLRFFVPYLILMILFVFFGSFALLLGLVVLVIGILFAALYLFTFYLFILPVMMVEGPSIANTIGRTFSLVHRRFWPNIGWTAVFILIMLVISVMMSGLVLLPFTGSFMKGFVNPGNASSLADITARPLYIILNAIISALVYPAMPIFACILYLNGRAREESLASSEIPKDDNEGKVRIEDLYSGPSKEDEPGRPAENDQGL